MAAHLFFQGDREDRYPVELIRKLSKAVAYAIDLEGLLGILVDLIVETFGVNRVILFLREQASGGYLPRASFGYDPGLLRELAFREGDPLVNWLKGQNQILRREEVGTEASSSEEVRSRLESIEAHLVVPLNCQGSLVGFIGVGNKVAGKEFLPADLELLFVLALYGAMAIKNALLYRQISLQRGYFQDVLEQVPSGIITVDAAGAITTFNRNAEAVLGLRASEMLGKDVHEVSPAFADLLFQTIRDRKSFKRHEIVNPTTGAPLGVSTAGLCDEAGAVRGATMIFSDLSELKQLERKARELERLQFWSTLSARLAHEIKNPLVAITTFAQLLEEKYEEEAFRQDFSRIVAREIERLRELVEQLRSFSQPRADRLGELDLHPLLDDVLACFQAEAARREIEVRRDYAPSPLRSTVEAERMHEAFCHLVKNSLEAMNKKGELTIATRGEAGLLEVDFRDSGPGIPLEDREKVFQPFHTTKNKGLGLGLPIARRIVEDHGGTIEWVPQSGRGGCFRVRLPLIS